MIATFALSFAPGFAMLEPMNTRPVGLAIIAASLTLLLGAMGQFWFANTQILPDSAINNALVTDGLFGLTRNPMYIAMVVMCLGFAFLLGRATMFAAPVMMLGLFVRPPPLHVIPTPVAAPAELLTTPPAKFAVVPVLPDVALFQLGAATTPAVSAAPKLLAFVPKLTLIVCAAAKLETAMTATPQRRHCKMF